MKLSFNFVWKIIFILVLLHFVITKTTFNLRAKNLNKHKSKLFHFKTNNHFIYNDPDNEIVLPQDIKYYNSPCGCVKIPIPRPKPKGHYEKKIIQTEQYIWVPSDKPSGLPGSFVVSDEEAHNKMHYHGYLNDDLI